MSNLRKIRGVFFQHRYLVVVVSVIVVFILHKLFHWRVICTNLEPWRHVNNLCNQYKQNKVSGDLCMSLCIGSMINSISCHSFHAGKEIVFTATHIDNKQMVFKLARKDDSNWFIQLEDKTFPNEVEFQMMIQKHVQTRLNISLSHEQAKRIGRFVNGDHAEQSSERRKAEIRDLWYLLQDNEYLLSTVFVDNDIFPRVVGSCGPYFAVEYLKPVMEGEVMSDDGNKDNWLTRVKLANMVIDLLTELDLAVKGGFSLCDIKPSHFGISKRSGKMKFLDLDVTLPKIIANRMIANSCLLCKSHSDCDLFDCKSKCNFMTGKCDKGVISNNLQIVCEKIFLGWKISGRLIMPGLLMSQHTPLQLASLLRQCAESDLENESLHNVQDRLITTLSEIERVLAAAGYDYDTNLV